MADNITITTEFKWVNGTRTSNPTFKSGDEITGTNKASFTVSATTSWAQVSFPAAMTSLGWLLLINQDITNFVEVGHWNGGTPSALITLPPGGQCLFKCAAGTTDLAIKADTAACDVDIESVED